MRHLSSAVTCQYLLALTIKNLNKACNFTGHKGNRRPRLGWVKGAGGILCRSHPGSLKVSGCYALSALGLVSAPPGAGGERGRGTFIA